MLLDEPRPKKALRVVRAIPSGKLGLGAWLFFFLAGEATLVFTTVEWYQLIVVTAGLGGTWLWATGLWGGLAVVWGIAYLLYWFGPDRWHAVR
jgi:hypothetical protein